MKRLILLFFMLCIGGHCFAQDVFSDGEAIKYDIKKFGLTVGQAELVFGGATQINNRDALLVTFRAKGPKFFDEEKIYLDPETFYPMMVVRDLDIFGKKEKIVEEYAADKSLVKITKTVGNKISHDMITKKGNRLDNIYGFIYRYRKHGRFQVGDTLDLSLPTKDVRITLASLKKIKVANKIFETHFMKSTPKKYKIWFDSSDKKIPLKIDGAVGMANASMVMKEYYEKYTR